MMAKALSGDDFSAWLSTLRHDFHKNPETAFNEIRTTQKIKEIFTDLNIELIEPVGLKTGVIAIFRGKKPGKPLRSGRILTRCRSGRKQTLPMCTPAATMRT